MSLAKEIMKKETKKKEGLLVIPILEDYLIQNGRQAQYTDEKGIKIVVEMLIEQNERIHRAGRASLGSSSSSHCMREQVLSLELGEEAAVEPEPRLIRIFEDGNWRNLQWLVIFHRMGILREYEEPSYNKKYNVGWTPDAVLDLSEYYGEDYDWVPLDVKGMNMNEFAAFKQRTGRGRFAASRIMQMHTYMLMSGTKSWMIWAENKNNQDYDEYHVPRDKNIIKMLKNRYKYMKQAVEEEKLPAVECDLDEGDPVFKKCPVKQFCVKAVKKSRPSLKPMKGRVRQWKEASKAFV